MVINDHFAFAKDNSGSPTGLAKELRVCDVVILVLLGGLMGGLPVGKVANFRARWNYAVLIQLYYLYPKKLCRVKDMQPAVRGCVFYHSAKL